MDKEIKLICLDLDGTTLKDISGISQKNINSIRKAYESGIKIAFSTGRLFVHALYYSKVIGIPTYIISNNGTHVYDTNNDLELYSSFIGVDNLTKIHKFVKEKYFNVHYSTTDTIYSNRKIENIEHEYKKCEYSLRNIILKDTKDWDLVFKNHGHKIFKACVSGDDKHVFESILDKMRKENEFEIEYSWLNTAEVLIKGEGKGKGVRVLKNYLNLQSENIMCIGDSENDVSMFRESGYKVAMGNAIDKLKDLSDFITLNVANDGVSYAIEKLLEQYK